MDLHSDFADLCSLSNANGVDFPIVGGYAVAFHGAPRFTGGLVDVHERAPHHIGGSPRGLTACAPATNTTADGAVTAAFSAGTGIGSVATSVPLCTASTVVVVLSAYDTLPFVESSATLENGRMSALLNVPAGRMK